MTKVLQLKFQCDADLTGNPDTKHFQTSYLGYLGESFICWCSTDQGSISTSTAESEIKAVNHTLKAEVIANRGILNHMGWTQSPIIMEEDNKACVDASILSHMTRNLTHLELIENFLKEKYADGTCVLVKVASCDNNADIGTKRVSRTLFDKLTDNIIDKSLRVVKYKKQQQNKVIFGPLRCEVRISMACTAKAGLKTTSPLVASTYAILLSQRGTPRGKWQRSSTALLMGGLNTQASWLSVRMFSFSRELDSDSDSDSESVVLVHFNRAMTSGECSDPWLKLS